MSLPSLSERLLTKLSALEAVKDKLSMNLRSPMLHAMKSSAELGIPSILRLPVWLLISTGFLDDQMTVLASEIVHDSG